MTQYFKNNVYSSASYYKNGYRDCLIRVINSEGTNTIYVICCKPSSADSQRDDKTIIQLKNILKHNNIDRFVVFNSNDINIEKKLNSLKIKDKILISWGSDTRDGKNKQIINPEKTKKLRRYINDKFDNIFQIGNNKGELLPTRLNKKTKLIKIKLKRKNGKFKPITN